MTQKFSKEELQNSKRIYKSATPKLTIDWYIKWVSSVLLIRTLGLLERSTATSVDIISFEVKASWVDLLQLVLITVIGAYFGGRSLEKVKK